MEQTYLPDLKNETFEAFSHIAKENETDSWIRREIHEEIKRDTLRTNQQLHKLRV